ncbi:PREDICTED: protein SPT2 homolog [Fragaria vesca subsp. vesca]|uniref:protein SPT2 homolog n=1 Tax=Fragaria vesca subsp. vesca TaxID=101020 RepID=UPI0002C34FAF|nr:PREDICTED: protein SPT2 homolog [Fragaria vesca subsp. vesca]XP_011460388.1 PREDICTED: protein SPT2 homolog [Fragaria vesca subsp. vesca]XP_011460389.1 PREDICTED: protein SPT2 homolog [Fragaria vesca subsp. vesca]
MPSGAKRRKAAKKKKEQETQNGDSSTTNKANPQGDEGKIRDEKGSDSGQVDSKPLAKEWRPVAKGKSVEGDSSDAEATRKDGGVKFERDLKEGSKSNKRAGSGKESSKGSSSSGSGSSSSSDGESRVVDRRRKEKGDASEEKPASVSEGKPARVSEEKPASVSEGKPASVSDGKPTHVSKEKPAGVSEGKPARVSEEKPASVSEEKPASDLVKSVDSLLAEVTHSAGDAPAEKTTSLDAEKTHSLHSDKPVASVPGMTVHLTETTQVDGLVISGTVVKPAVESGTEKLLPTGDPESLTDSLPEKIESMVTPMPIENGKASPSMAESVSKENGSKVLPSLVVSVAQTSNDAGSIKDSEIPEYSESQPLVAPAPRVVEKTSWFGCCGILDVITGSRR